MRMRILLLALAAALGLLALTGCGGDTPTTTELVESTAQFTIDACQVSGTAVDSSLSMQVDYTATNHEEEPFSQITILTPHLEESPMSSLELTLGDKTYPLTVADKDVIDLDAPVSPGEQFEMSITYQVEDLPQVGQEEVSWRITIPTLDRSATSTGIGEVAVQIDFDAPIKLSSSLPVGLKQDGDTRVAGSLGNLVNLIVLELEQP